MCGWMVEPVCGCMMGPGCGCTVDLSVGIRWSCVWVYGGTCMRVLWALRVGEWRVLCVDACSGHV